MSENTSQSPGTNGDEQKRLRLLLALLGILVGIEALLATAGAIYFLSRIFLETPENLSRAIVIFVITLVFAIGLVITAIATFRAQSWTRGAIITWQILQFAVATSFIQGIVAWQPVGWMLIVASVLCGILVMLEMSKSYGMQK